MMKLGLKKVCINAPFPTCQCGHITQTNLIVTVHDPLYARIMVIDDGTTRLCHISFDLLAFSYDQYQRLVPIIEDKFGPDCKLITSATHTHSGHDVRNEHYLDWLHQTLVETIESMELIPVEDLSFTVKQVHDQTIGKSRISGYESNNELLTTIDIHENGSTKVRMIIYNCHPTVLSADVPYFSAEFPGYVLAKEEALHPDMFVTYINGACGDISTRFTRKDQTYDSVIQLGDHMVETIESMDQVIASNPLKLNLCFYQLNYEHTFDPIDLSHIRAGLSQREYITIEFGQIMRAKLKEMPESLIHTGQIETLDFNGFTIVFFSNEIFSAYMDLFDPSRNLLVSYSNGYGPYILPIGFEYLTYETFTDTLTVSTKEKLMDLFKSINGSTKGVN